MSFCTPLPVLMTTEHGMQKDVCLSRPSFEDELILIQTDVN